MNDDNGETIEVQGLFDTGTQMSVIKEDLINPLQYQVPGEVKLLGFNDNMCTGKVISLFAKLNDQDLSVPIKFVACQHVTQNCLLSLADYRALLQNQEVRSTRGQTQVTPDNTDDLPTCVGHHSRHLMWRVMTSTLATLVALILVIRWRLKMKILTLSR